MKLLQNKIFLSYKTTERSQSIINELQKSYRQFLLTAIEYFQKTNLEYDREDPQIFPLDMKPSVLESLRLSADYYFHLLQNGITLPKVKKLIDSDVALSFKRKSLVVSTEKDTTVILIPDVCVVLSVNYSQVDNIKEIQLCKNKIILGD